MNHENKIRDAILDYLNNLPMVMAWPVYSGGRYLAKIKRMVPMKHRWHRSGVPDIIGVYNGFAFAVETKTATGRLEPHQEAWGHEFMCKGGEWFLARSLKQFIEDFKRMVQP